MRPVRRARVGGAQHLVAGEHVADGLLQRGHVERAGQPDGQRDVVHRRGGRVELVEEPVPLLSGRQRDARRALPRLQARPVPAGPGVVLHPGGQRLHSGRLEQVAHRELGVQRGAQPRGHLGGQQRVAAEFEEVVVQADPRDAEHIAEGARHDLLDRGGRGPEHLGLEHRRGQRLAIQLAGGVQRELLQHDERRGHHVGGQLAAEFRAHALDVHRTTGGRDDVRDQLVAEPIVRAHHDHGLGDRFQGRERRLDLAQLDAQTAQLHLEVGAAQVLQLALVRPGHQVAGAVHPLAVAERVGYEAVGGQIRTRDIAAGQLNAREVQLTRDTHRHRVQPRIQYVHLGVEHRGADRHRHRVVLGHLVEGDVDRGLGRTVQVVQPRAGEFLHPLRGGGGQRLTGGEDIAQAGAFVGAFLGGRVRPGGGSLRDHGGPRGRRIQHSHEHRQHRWHEVRRGDLLAGDDLHEVGRVAMTVGLGHHEAGADLQGPEELPHRHVEGGRGLLQHHVGVVQAVLVLHPHQAVDDRGVRDRHTLRAAGRTGGEDHVRGVRRTQRRAAIRVDQRLVGVPRQRDHIDLDSRGRARVETVARGGEHAHRLRGVEHVAGAVGRVVRVQRHVRATGDAHRVHADHEVDRAAHAERDHRIRADAQLDQVAGKAVHPAGELGVGQSRPLERHRGRVRGPRQLRGEHRHQRGRRVHRMRRVVPPLQHLGALDAVEQLDVADGHRRVRGDRGQHPHQPRRDTGDGVGVEHVGRVREFGGHAVGGAPGVEPVGQVEVQVELRGHHVQRNTGHFQAGQLEGGLPGVLERQHHLEQRVARLRTRRVQDLHQPLERQVRVRERREVGVLGARQQFGERFRGIDRAAQHQSVDEHADRVVEHRFTAARDRGADGDVVAAGQPGQQGGERRVHHHEQTGAVRAGQRVQLAQQPRVERELVHPTAVGRHRGTRAVRRQVQLIGQSGQGVGPERDLLGDQRRGIGFGAQRLALPQRVVGVLHRQRSPGGRLAARTRGVGHHHVARQRTHRPAVTGDVVHHEHQHVGVGLRAVHRARDAEQRGTHRDLGGDVEAGQHQFADPVGDLGLGHLDRGEIDGVVPGGQHHLHALAVGGLRVDGAQHLVPVDHVGDGLTQRLGVQRSGEPDRERDVVHRGLVVEAVQEPHALLRQRQRDLGRARARDELTTAAGALVGLHPGRKRGHGRRLEQGADRDPGVQRGAEPGHHLGGDQRVAAQVEEVVVQADRAFGAGLRQAQHLGEDIGDDLLHRSRRCAEFPCLEDGFGQRAPIQLAVRVQRHRVEHDDRGGHHVRRQVRGQVRPQRLDIHRGAVRGHHVAHQLIAGVRVGAHQRDRLRDRFVGGQRGLDLAELDAQTAQLHLEVGAAQVLDGAGDVPGDQVAGAVHPRAVLPIRVGHEPVGGQIRATEVAARQLIAREVQLAGDVRRHRVQARVQHVRLRVPHRKADRHSAVHLVGDGSVGGVHRELGGAVQVVQRRVAHPPDGDDRVGCERLTGDEQRPQRGERADVGRVDTGREDAQHGRHERGHGDPLGRDHLGEVLRVAVPVRARHHDAPAGAQRAEQLPHRHVEGGGGLEQHHVVRADAVFAGDPADLVDDRRMRHGDALRTSGRTRGEDHVRRVLRAQRRDALGVGDGCVRVAGQVQLVDVQRRAARAVERVARGGQHADRVGRIEHVVHAVGGLVQVQRHVAAARGVHRVGGNDQVHRAAHAQGDQCLRADARLDEAAREPPHPGGEFGVAQNRSADRVDHGDRVRRGRGLRGELLDQRGRRAEVAGGVVPAAQRLRGLLLVQQRDVADRPVRFGGDGLQQPAEAAAELGHGGRVEQVGGVDQLGGDARAGAARGFGIAFRQHQLQVELGDVDRQVDTAHRQTGQLETVLAGVLERQHHLEQRVARLRTRRVQDLHQPLERQVGVPERGDVGGAHRTQQLGERRTGLDRGPQHQGVDEHADQVVERALATTRDRRADRDVVLARQPRQQHGQRGVRDHEQRRAPGTGEFGELGVGLGVDLEDVRGAAAGGDRGARPVGGQVQLLGQAAQGVRPERDLLGDHRTRVVLGAEHLALPQREVGVLHLQRTPGGLAAVDAGAVGGHHVPGQRAHGETVGRDVVHHQGEHVLGGADLEQPGAERHLGGDVEGRADQPRELLGQFGFGDVDRREIGDDLRGGHGLLTRRAVHLGVERAQRLVAGQHVGDGDLQRLPVEQPGQPYRGRDVVHRRVGVEAVEEPHALLGQRQRNQLRSLLRRQRRTAADARLGLRARRQRDHGGRLEQFAHAEVGVQRGRQPRGDLGGRQRVAAEGEEVVVQADPLQAEHVGEGRGDDLLDRRGRGAEHRGLEHRRGQRLAVQLAGGVEREFLQHDHDRRHHVRGQLPRQVLADQVGVQRGVRSGDDVRDELVARVRVRAHHDDRLGDFFQAGQRLLDLTQLDTQTTQLHLEISTAQILQFTVLAPRHQVTGAVHPRTRLPVRIRHEPVGGQVGTRDVTPCELDARQIQLTRDTHRHRTQARIQHEHLGVEHRSTDRHRLGVGIDHLVEGDVDRGLGRTVEVVQRGAGQLTQTMRGLRRQRLTRGEHQPQRTTPRRSGIRHEHREHRRHEVGDAHLLGADDLREVSRVAMPIGLRHHQASTDLQRPEELPHRHIERRRRLLQHHIIGGQLVGRLHPHQTVDNRRVRDGNTLRTTRRTRRENHIRGIRRTQRRTTIRVGDRSLRQPLQVEQIDAHLRGVDVQIAAGGQHAHRVGRAEDVFGALGRVIRVQRHVRATGHGDGVHADHQIDRASHAKRHIRFRADAARDQPARQLVHPPGELGIGETCPLERDRGRVGSAFHLVVEHRDQGRAVGGGRGHIELGVVPAAQHEFALGGVEQLDVADHRVGRGGDRGEHPDQAVGDAAHRLLVEQVAQVARAHPQPRIQLRDQGQRVVCGVGRVEADHGHAVDVRGLRL
ncbi:hypothetical protein NG2371_00962 [Nocardia gamkensis]|nr:hypothetical protein [Nocardia gamkensis]